MSKFEYDCFYGDDNYFAVNSEKFTKEQATKIFEFELDSIKGKPKIGREIGEWKLSQAFVKWRAGINDDNEPCVGWWLEFTKRPKGSCPVWLFTKLTKWNVEEILEVKDVK